MEVSPTDYYGQTPISQVREFQDAVDQPVGLCVKDHPDLLAFRIKLIAEEYLEVMGAYNSLYNIVHKKANKTAYVEAKADLLKELQDLKYVIEGLCISFGFDSDTAFNRVHTSNMSKLDEDGGVMKDKDGKVMKSPNYKPPVLSDLVNEEREVYATITDTKEQSGE